MIIINSTQEIEGGCDMPSKQLWNDDADTDCFRNSMIFSSFYIMIMIVNAV